MSDIPPPTVPPATPPPPGGGSYTPPPPPPPGGGGYSGGGGNLGGGPPAGGDRTMMIVLSYLWVLFLIPLLTKKEDAEVQWHAKNGMGITIGELLVWVVYTILSFILPGDGCLSWIFGTTFGCIIFIAFAAIRIIAIIKGVNGQRFTVPVLSDLGAKINL